MPLVEIKVSGVTFGNRQKAIEHLSRYAPDQISIRLVRDSQNKRDRNAVAVYELWHEDRACDIESEVYIWQH